MEKNETNIVIRDDKIKVKQEKQHLLGGLGFLLLLFGVISFGYKNGSHGISDMWTFGTLIIGSVLIALDFSSK